MAYGRSNLAGEEVKKLHHLLAVNVAKVRFFERVSEEIAREQDVDRPFGNVDDNLCGRDRLGADVGKPPRFPR